MSIALANTKPNTMNRYEYNVKHKTAKPTFFNNNFVINGQQLFDNEFLSKIIVYEPNSIYITETINGTNSGLISEDDCPKSNTGFSISLGIFKIIKIPIKILIKPVIKFGVKTIFFINFYFLAL